MGSSKKRPQPDEREKISTKINQASDTVGDLLKSIVVSIEDRIAVEDQVKSITRDADHFLDRVDMVKKEKQKQVLLAYRTFLEENLAAVNYRIKKLR